MSKALFLKFNFNKKGGRNDNSQEGRQSPSSVPSYQDLTGSKLSTPQTVNGQNITPINNGVNSLGWENLPKSFEDTSSVEYVAQNKFMPQNNLGQAGGLSQNPYGNIVQLQRDKEDLEELLRRLKLLQSRWR